MVVPDDARELESDRLRWLAEQERRTPLPGQERRRTDRWPAADRPGDGEPAPRLPPVLRRLLLTRRWYRYGLSGPLVVVVLVMVAGVASLAVFLAPRLPPGPPARALASPADRKSVV